MKILPFFFVLVCSASGAVPADAQVNVTQFHNHESRDGLYIDVSFTSSAAANLTRDLSLTAQFRATFMPNRFTSKAARVARQRSSP
jgi:hypothetical protein